MHEAKHSLFFLYSPSLHSVSSSFRLLCSLSVPGVAVLEISLWYRTKTYDCLKKDKPGAAVAAYNWTGNKEKHFSFVPNIKGSLSMTNINSRQQRPVWDLRFNSNLPFYFLLFILETFRKSTQQFSHELHPKNPTNTAWHAEWDLLIAKGCFKDKLSLLIYQEIWWETTALYGNAKPDRTEDNVTIIKQRCIIFLCSEFLRSMDLVQIWI